MLVGLFDPQMDLSIVTLALLAGGIVAIIRLEALRSKARRDHERFVQDSPCTNCGAMLRRADSICPYCGSVA